MPVILQKIMTQTWKQNDCKQDGENVFPFTRLKFKTLQDGESIIKTSLLFQEIWSVCWTYKSQRLICVKKKEKRKFSEKHCHWAWGEKHCQWASDSCIIAPLHCIALTAWPFKESMCRQILKKPTCIQRQTKVFFWHPKIQNLKSKKVLNPNLKIKNQIKDKTIKSRIQI